MAVATEDFNRMPNEQFSIARAVVQLLKPGGMLVYNTCSIEPEENEELLRRLIAEIPALRLRTEKCSLPFRDGFDGAFAAKLFKTGDAG